MAAILVTEGRGRLEITGDIMLAILGLVGAAVAAFMFIDTSEDEETSATQSDSEGSVPAVKVTPLVEMLPPSDADTVIFSGDADDTVVTGAGNDHLDGEDGDDRLVSGAGNDTLEGGRGSDVLEGGAGDDQLNGHVGDDILLGGAGNDALNGGGGADHLDGSDGDDWLLGSLGDDVLVGGAGADTLHGGQGDDLLYDRGDMDRDYINGGAGNDTLTGDQGDLLNGGPGADVFALARANGVAIEDFEPAEDTIEITYEGPPPQLATVRSEAGLTLLADGEVIAIFENLDHLDLDQVMLVAA